MEETNKNHASKYSFQKLLAAANSGGRRICTYQGLKPQIVYTDNNK